MNKCEDYQVEQFQKKRQKWKVWKKIVGALVCIAVLCTSYVQNLPAATLEETVDYGQEEQDFTEEITSETPTVVTSASTSEFVELNLYDYGTNINEKYRLNKEYPGFQWNGGAYLYSSTYNRHTIDFIDFGNSMITDLTYGSLVSDSHGKSPNNSLVGKTDGSNGAINKLDYSSYGVTNRPIGMSLNASITDMDADVLSRTIGSDGYPVLKSGDSLSYLFNPNEGYAKKQNTTSIDGLFQQDTTTGGYYYNSRLNHAQYSDNTFTLYNQIITPNFISYPFGNFLPFNDITQNATATQVSQITSLGNYIQGIRDNLTETSDFNSNATKQQLVYMLDRYKADLQNTTLENGTAWDNWTAKNAIVDYLTGIGDHPTDDSSLITDALLRKLYNIDWDVETNFFFGMEMKMNFIQPKGGMTGNDTNKDGESDYPMRFYFTGDDDVWVYIDDVLFLDLSGIHRHVGGEIDFVNGKVYYYNLDTANTGDVSATPYQEYTFAEILSAAGKNTDGLSGNGTFKDYTTHTFKFYYMERGSGSSVCRLNFNFPLLRQNSISVSKEVEADSAILGTPDYKFQILKADTDGTKIDDLFIAAGTTYTIYDENDNKVGTGTTDANGVFSIKAGQRAEFMGIEENAGKYYVRELLDETVTGQYGGVTVSGESTTTSANVVIGSERFTGIDSPVKDMTDGATAFRFVNHVDESKMGRLNISKKMVEYSEIRDKKYFDIQVAFDGVLLPVGTEYSVDKETRTVATAGIITIATDETATIHNILAGTTFTIQETKESAKGYTVTYEDSGGYTITENDGVVDGVIKSSADVQLMVTNAEKGTTITIPGTKTISNPDGKEHVYTFQLDETTDWTGSTLKEDGISGYKAEVTTSDTSGEGAFSFNIRYVEVELGALSQKFYYKITEETEENSLANTTAYVVEVTVSENAEGLRAMITEMWKDGIQITESEDYSADFVNTLVGDLVLSKTVVGSSAGEFTFEIKLDSEETKTYSLKNGDFLRITDIPYGTTWTITETNADGYKVTYAVSANEEVMIVNGVGCEATGNIVVGTTTVAYTNTQLHALPEAGGVGTSAFMIGGIAFVSLAVILFYNKKRGKEEKTSY